MVPSVAVNDLRVGMFIHLDIGWMRHPFPLSSFRIASAKQIEVIRGLGLERVRWAPDRSEVESVGAADQDLPASLRAGGMAPSDAAARVSVPVESPEAAAARTRREALSAQRAVQLRLERQYAEASLALRNTCRQARERPEAARADAEALARSLVDKLLVDGEMCIRLLSASAGDRAAEHGMNVAVIALLLGRSFGFAEADMMDLGVGAMLHDLGKLDLPDRVRHLDPGLTSAEAQAYREHVGHGVTLGRRMGLNPRALLVLAQHHEQADGSGFPLRLNGETMSRAARIVSLVDRYDNLCNPATQTRAITPHEAMALLFAQCRNKFDSTILNAFIRMMGVYPAGSLVQLTDDRYALVVGVNATRPLKPRVLAFDVRTPHDEALILDLERAPELGIRRSLSPAKLPAAALEYLAPRQRVAYFFDPLPLSDDEDSMP